MNCEFCGNIIETSFSTRFCSKRCSRRFSASKVDPTKKKICICIRCHKPFETNIHCSFNTTRCPECKKLPYIYKCNLCGQTPCQRKDICRKFNLFPTLISRFGMKESAIGTTEIYKEYERIQTLIREEYLEDKLSLIDLSKKYKHNNIRNFSKILNSLDIDRRSLSEGALLAIASGKLVPHSNTIYNHGYHTSWNNKQVYYRSSYELDYYKILDTQKIDYEIETLRIQYWDTIQLRFRTAIPDIYIPSINTIIEIKSSYTFNEQNMLDKFKTYKQHGYNTKLILEKQEVELLVLPVGAAPTTPTLKV